MKPAVHILSLPRCGTHFIWSRMIQTGRYRLIYDADRVPALEVLRRHYHGKVALLYPAPKNPNYNFQYNSLQGARGPMTPSEHLGLLRGKYGAEDNFCLFSRAMERQDDRGMILFSVNRFVYTSCNELFRNEAFEWTNEHAMESLRLLVEWSRRLPAPSKFCLVIRDVAGWVRSQCLMYGASKWPMIAKRLRGFPRLLQTCRELGIPVHDMSEVVARINGGCAEFWDELEPLGVQELEARSNEALARVEQGGSGRSSSRPAPVRLGRLMAYLTEMDPIRRTSLVRSIGWLPSRIFRAIPALHRRYLEDFEGTVLNNAAIRLETPTPAAQWAEAV